MNAQLPVFLTAYDPTELPGGTIDPLGFMTGYMALADRLFPGMTAAASQATYLPMLCAGLAIAETQGDLAGLSASAARKRRVEIALRFERLWALAAALQIPERSHDDEADEEESDADSKTAGLRGVTYAKRQAERLTQAGAKDALSEFALLAQQFRYGAFGIYSGVAEQLRLLDKSTFAPSPGFGDAIGRGFLETTTESNQRKELIRAALDPSISVRIGTLLTWGKRAHPGAPLLGQGRSLLGEAIHQDHRRARTLRLVQRVYPRWSESDSGPFLETCCEHVDAKAEPELAASLRASLTYDEFLREFTLIFERVLWLCRKMNDAEEVAVVAQDSIVLGASHRLPKKALDFLASFERLSHLGSDDLRSRSRGIIELAEQVQHLEEAELVVRKVLQRHAEVQRGRFNLGRPKMPWIEERGTHFAVTSGRVGIRAGEPRTVEGVRGPDWRFDAALSLLFVTGQLEKRRPR